MAGVKPDGSAAARPGDPSCLSYGSGDEGELQSVRAWADEADQGRQQQLQVALQRGSQRL